MDYPHSRPSAVQTTGHLNRRDIEMQIGSLRLRGELAIPSLVKGIVLFAHGSGSSRFSPRNQFVAYELNQAELATCLFDLLTLEEEEEDQHSQRYRFDIPLLAQRLLSVTDWVQTHLQNGLSLPIGYFGASTGAAAALIAAADRPDLIKAVVSRGGRPDLAANTLQQVRTPTLLIVGEADELVHTLNRKAQYEFPPDTPCELITIPGAGHLFETPEQLDQVAQYASQWFEKYLTS